MPRLPHPRFVCFLLGSFLAAATACGKRVDRTAREQAPAASASASAAPSTPGGGAPSANSSGLIHVSAQELDALLRGPGRHGTVVNVWATWCGPCREELPMLAKVQSKYAARGLTVLPLSVDEPEAESKIPAMLASYGFRGPFYVAERPLDEIKRRLNERWPGNIPVSFLFDSEARRRFFWTAQIYESELAPRLDQFLENKLESGQADFGVAPGKTF